MGKKTGLGVSPVRINVSRKEGTAMLSLRGSIDENANMSLSHLHSHINERDVAFNFAQVDYVNSLGVRCWIHFLRSFQEGRRITFWGCSSDIVSQMSILPDFQGHGTVRSILAEYECESCSHHTTKEFNVPDQPDALWHQLDHVICPNCKSEMLSDEDEEVFLFLFQEAS